MLVLLSCVLQEDITDIQEEAVFSLETLNIVANKETPYS
jgi:hypothetical protein